MLQQPSLIQVGITLEDIVKAYKEIVANTEAINRITADPLFLIMSKLDPKSVLKTCESTKQFARLCRNPKLFSALMRVHYPNYFETDNPREQYIAITNGLETTYRMKRKISAADFDEKSYWTEFENPVQYGKTQAPWNIPGFKLKGLSTIEFEKLMGPGYVPGSLLTNIHNQLHTIIGNARRAETQTTPEEIQKLYEAGKVTDEMLQYGKPEEYFQDHDTEVVFAVKGYPIPRGIRAWLLILQSHAAGVEDKVEVFKSKSALAQHFIEHEYPALLQVFIDEFLDNVPPEEFEDLEALDDARRKAAIFASPAWKFDLESRALPYPFTKENVYEYIMENDRLEASPNSERNSWLFREVTF